MARRALTLTLVATALVGCAMGIAPGGSDAPVAALDAARPGFDGAGMPFDTGLVPRDGSDSTVPRADAADAIDASTERPDVPVDAAPPCVSNAPCTTSCGTGGTTACASSGAASCTPPREICNGVDDNCDGRVDELDCTHQVQCEVFASGYAAPSAPGDAIFMPAAATACVPGGPTGYCQQWFGRCHALPAADGHTHDVSFSVFDDGYANITPAVDAVYLSGPTSACVPGGSTGTCRRWFGRGVTNVVQDHMHTIRCSVFDDAYANLSGPSDAILWNGSQLCVPGGASGTCRRWFGRCSTR